MKLYEIMVFHAVKHSKIQMKSQPAFASSKLTIETVEEDVKYVKRPRSGVFIANFKHISHLVLVFSLLTLNK